MGGNDSEMTLVSHSAMPVSENDGEYFPLIRFRGVPVHGDFDRLMDRAEALVVHRTGDRRPFRAVIEVLQNLERHAQEGTLVEFDLEGKTKDGESLFRIRTTNVVRPEDRDRLAGWLAQSSCWGRSFGKGKGPGMALRHAHREALNQGERTPRGGAGLGWLSMARVAKRPPVAVLLGGKREERLSFSVEVAC